MQYKKEVIKMGNFKCTKCEYEWNSRVEKPVACPRCKNYKWDEPTTLKRGQNVENNTKTS
jgi:predicted Zn-ribbon and HTH transcriptional regulator